MDFTSAGIDTLGKLLEVASLRHQVIANNVANVNTPGFRQQLVHFEEAFAREADRGNTDAALQVKPKIVEATGVPERADGNNVDIDVEMVRLQKNTLLYRTIAQVMSIRLAALRSAITGR